MEKLLHERLREFENIGKDECALNNFYDLCLDAKNCKECHKTALNALADEIEHGYIPREDHDREMKEIIEAQGGSFPSAHHVMKKWAEGKGMKWPDNASITEFLDYHYISRPRFEDGEPVQFGDEVEGCNGKVEAMILFEDGSGTVYGEDDECLPKDNYGADIELGGLRRPTPKVLDADGVEVKEGEIVYGTGREQHRYKVLNPYDECNGGRFTVKCLDLNDDEAICHCDPTQLTHKEPVLDADGVPIKVGDTVWHIGDSERGEIIGFTEDNWHFDVKIQWDKGDQGLYAGEYLTHKEPVLDADGTPIREGDTVYFRSVPTPHIVEVVKQHYVKTADGNQYPHPDKDLTHKEPDSLEKLRDDMEKVSAAKDVTYGDMEAWINRLSALIEMGRQ